MGWRYGDWSQILFYGISSSTLSSEQAQSVFHYIPIQPIKIIEVVPKNFKNLTGIKLGS